MKKRRFRKVGTAMQIIFALVMFILLILLIMWYQDGLNSYKPGEEVYYYCAGMKIQCSDQTRLIHREEGVVLQDNKAQDMLSSTPLVYENQKRLVLTTNNMLMQPKVDNKVYRLNEFTEVTEAEGRIIFEKSGKSAQVLSGFLYDGSDTYIFLEEVTLYIGTKQVNLLPLSYVTVNYRQTVEYHDSENDKYEWIDLAGADVKAEFTNGVTLDLGKDLISKDGNDSILFSAVDSLKVLELK